MISSNRSPKDCVNEFQLELPRLFVELALTDILARFHSALTETEQGEINGILGKLVHYIGDGDDIYKYVINAIDHGGIAGGLSILSVIKSNRLDVIKLFVDAGSNINDASDYYLTPLCTEISGGSITKVIALVEEYGADINYVGSARCRIKCDADVDHTASECVDQIKIHGTPLAFAVERYLDSKDRDNAFLKYLLSKNASTKFNPDWEACKSISQEQFNAAIEQARAEQEAAATVFLPALEDYTPSGAASGHDELTGDVAD